MAATTAWAGLRLAAGAGAIPETDARLVARVAERDAAALGALYDRHGAASYALARAMVHGAGDAEDVVAQVFAQLWRTAAGYDPARGSVATWITMLTRSRALDLLRAQRRRTRLHERAAAGDADGVAVPLGGSGEAPDAAAERGGQRRAIELAFFGGLSHGEVAATLGEPLGTVKTRIRTGMQRLREALRPHVCGGDR